MSTRILVLLLMCVVVVCQHCPEPSYFMQDTKRTWCTWLTLSRDTLHNTRSWCAENGGGLLFTIEDRNVQNYFDRHVAPSLRSKNISKVWINYNPATRATFEEISLTFEKNELLSNDECVTIDTAGGDWEQMRCSEAVQGLCYKVIECPSGAFIDTENELCFWVTNTVLGAEKGQRQCLNEYGTLGVVPISQSQLSLASDLRRRYMLSFIPNNEMWIGVTDACYEGDFYDWMGETLSLFTHGSLQQLAQSNAEPIDCVVINVESEQIELFVRNCSERRVSICSRRFDVSGNYTIPPSANVVCPEKTTPSLQKPTLTTSTEPPTTSNLTSTMTSTSTTSKLTTTTVKTKIPTITTAAATKLNHAVFRNSPTIATAPDVCHWPKYVTKFNSTAALDKRLANLRTNTFIDKKKTTAHKRRLASADDPRPSSRNIGVAATIVMTSVFVLIILPDVINCVLAIWKRVRPGTTPRNKVFTREETGIPGENNCRWADDSMPFPSDRRSTPQLSV